MDRKKIDVVDLKGSVPLLGREVHGDQSNAVTGDVLVGENSLNLEKHSNEGNEKGAHVKHPTT